MKPSINNFLCYLCVACAVAACSSKPEEQPPADAQPAITQEIVVEKPIPVPETVAPAKTPAVATPQAPVSQGVLNLKAWDKKLKFLKTHFEQTSEYDGVPITRAQGTLFYDKDKHLLRLDTLNTNGKVEQSAITDKEQILILDADGRAITTLSWDEWQQGQPNRALFDFGNYTALLAKHKVVAKEPYLLELTPKEGEPYTLYLTLSKQDYFPEIIKIVSGDMVTQAVLSDTQKNEPLLFDTFRAGGLFK